MAEPILRLRNNAGDVVFDSRDAVAGCIGNIVEVPASTAQTLTYPLFVGRAAIPVNIEGRRMPLVVVDYDLGYPRVTFDTWGAMRRAVIWIV